MIAIQTIMRKEKDPTDLDLVFGSRGSVWIPFIEEVVIWL